MLIIAKNSKKKSKIPQRYFLFTTFATKSKSLGNVRCPIEGSK